MHFQVSNIPRSRKDRKICINLPKKLSVDLAYFLGIHFGDGHMNVYHRKKKIDYVITYTGSLENDYLWFQEKLSPLVLKLFNKKVTPRIGTKNTVVLQFRSKAVTHFLHEICGLPFGPKINSDVPPIIENAEPKFQKSFIRGLADTDFCLTFKARHKKECYYPVIEYHAACHLMWLWLKEVLRQFGFQIYANQRICKRNSKEHHSYYIQINGNRMLSKWINEIGLSSYTHLSKLNCWKKTGTVPPFMNIKERTDYLKNKTPLARIEFARNKAKLATSGDLAVSAFFRG